MSEGVYNAWVLQCVKIYVRHKNYRQSILLPDLAMEITVDDKMHGFRTVSTFCLNINGDVFPPQLPLHEGRRNSVSRSGGI